MSNFYVVIVVLVGLGVTALLLGFIFSSSVKSKEVFEAVDGTKFSSKVKLNEYEFLYERFKCLYEEKLSSDKSNKKNANIGLNSTFVQLIKTDGFRNLNALISNKEQFKKLVELFDTSEMSSN